MKFRLHCVFASPHVPTIHDGSPCQEACVQVMQKQGLCAVFSEVFNVTGAYDVSKMMQHHKVIDSFFHQATVLPFRFDTILEDLDDLALLLETRGDSYKQILRRLDGCAEMGIRAMVRESTAAPAAGCPSGDFPPPAASNPGKLYLRNLKTRYADESRLAEKHEQIAGKFRAAFSGIFKEIRTEASRLEIQGSDPRSFLVSLYFLVAKDRISSFRNTFDALASTESSKLLLSGPWPPYNFVLPGNPQPK